MYDDPIVNEVRKTRERLAAKFDFDVGAIFKDLRKRQAKLGTKLVHRQRRRGTERTPAPGR
jgi:hypothetical protein